MKIGLLSLSHHAYKISDFCKILEYEDIIVITKRDSCYQIKKKENVEEVICRREEETWGEFFDRVEKLSEDIDAIISLTSHNSGKLNSELLSFKPKCRFISWMHYARVYSSKDSNALKKWLLHVRKNLSRSIVGRISDSVFSRMESIFKPYPMTEADHVFVLKKEMKKYLEKNEWNTSVSVFVPAIFTHGKTSKEGGETTKVVVPGKVSQDRKKYIEVIDMFDEELEKHEGNIKLEILGNTEEASRKLRKKINDVSDRRWLITHPPGRVPLRKFKTSLRSADLILLPPCREKVHPNFRNRINWTKSVKEKVGITTASGAIWDAIEYALPIFVPKWYISGSEKRGMYFAYGEKQNVCKKIRRCKTNGILQKIKKEAMTKAKDYEKSKQADRLKNMIK